MSLTSKLLATLATAAFATTAMAQETIAQSSKLGNNAMAALIRDGKLGLAHAKHDAHYLFEP